MDHSESEQLNYISNYSGGDTALEQDKNSNNSISVGELSTIGVLFLGAAPTECTHS